MGCAFGFSRSDSPKKFSCSFVKFSCSKNGISAYGGYAAQDTAPNPNPYRFKIIEHEVRNGNTIITAYYPDCTTFDGRKLMVLRGTFQWEYIKVLDPHFLENHPVVARFLPTREGYDLACMVADNIGKLGV